MTFYYYYAGSRLLEVREGGSADGNVRRQFVWGTQYIDEAIAMDLDTDGDGDCLDFDDTGSNPDGGAERYLYRDADYNIMVIGLLVDYVESKPIIVGSGTDLSCCKDANQA